MTRHRFPKTFAPCIGHRCHQEQKEAAFVDDCCCSRHWLVTFVGDKSIGVLAPECVLFYKGEAHLNRNAVRHALELCESLYCRIIPNSYESKCCMSRRS